MKNEAPAKSKRHPNLPGREPMYGNLKASMMQGSTPRSAPAASVKAIMGQGSSPKTGNASSSVGNIIKNR